MDTVNLRLNFYTDQSNIVRLTVRRSRLDVTSLMVDNSMDEIVRTNAYNTIGRGNIIYKHSAAIIHTNTIKFDVEDQ